MVGGLANNTTYYWRVSASNAGGASAYSSPWSFTTIVACPPPPVLASPANNSINQPTSLTLSRNASSGATSYHVQVSTSSTFTSLDVDDAGLSSTSDPVSGLANNTTYYWRVSASNAGGTSAYSSPWSFTTIVAGPPPPILASPPNSSADQPTSLTLNSNAPWGANSYHVPVSTSSTFTTLEVDDAALSSTSDPVSGLSNNTTYYWRVSASNAGGTSAYSSAWSFTTIVAGPPPPVLASPANSSVNQPTSLTLSWNASSGATSYHVQVSTNSSFNTSEVRRVGMTCTSDPVTGLSNNTTYYWRVSASNPGGTSAYSSPWSFTTIVAGPPPPVLASPANNSINQPTSLTLSWNASSGATSYHVQVSTNTSFN